MNTGSMTAEGISLDATCTTSTTASVGAGGDAAIIHRYYDPNTGRYPTPDPLATEISGFSEPIFDYARGNSIVLIDQRSGCDLSS
jgi:RHS repeat-associated protein